MITPHDMTIYNKYISAGEERYQRTQIPGVKWESTKAVSGTGAGKLASNVATVYIPLERDANYLNPKAWQALTTKTGKWTLQDGDVIVKGLITDEITTSMAGVNLISNGDFSTSDDWILDIGWAISGGKAVATNTIGYQVIQSDPDPLTPGTIYSVTFTCTVVSGSVFIASGITEGTFRTASGTYTENLTANVDGEFKVVGGIFTGTVDNISAVMSVPTPAFTMSQLFAKYDNILVISSVDKMDAGSANIQHWQVGAK